MRTLKLLCARPSQLLSQELSPTATESCKNWAKTLIKQHTLMNDNLHEHIMTLEEEKRLLADQLTCEVTDLSTHKRR